MSADTEARAGALVTGGARGLGYELARRLLQRGHRVHITDLDGEAAARAARELGSGAFSSALDVRDEAACREAATVTVERAGSLGLWVNNAGVLFSGAAWTQESATRRLMLDVNVHGTINGTLAALEVMRPSERGHILNIISLSALAAAPGLTIYSASKHAAIAFSLGTLADLRLAGVRGIDISCLCPDGMWTPMLQDKLADPDTAASFSGVLYLPEQVAERAMELVDRPRPVLSMPRWRSALLRAGDLLPRLALAGTGPALAYGRLRQRRYRRRVEAGGWPPRPW